MAEKTSNGSGKAAPAINGDAYPITEHEYDVLVIGAGGAGLRAAIEASAKGVSVGLVCRNNFV